MWLQLGKCVASQFFKARKSAKLIQLLVVVARQAVEAAPDQPLDVVPLDEIDILALKGRRFTVKWIDGLDYFGTIASVNTKDRHLNLVYDRTNATQARR